MTIHEYNTLSFACKSHYAGLATLYKMNQYIMSCIECNSEGWYDDIFCDLRPSYGIP